MDFVALDVETANADLASICQIGIATFQQGRIIDEFSTLIDPEDYFDPMNVYIHGITEDDVRNAPSYAQINEHMNAILDGQICATHTHFDRSAIHQSCSKNNVPAPDCSWLDTARVARRTWENVAHKGYGLAPLAEMLGIEFRHHDALEDAKTAGQILIAAISKSGLNPGDWLSRVKQPIDPSFSDPTGVQEIPMALYMEKFWCLPVLWKSREEKQQI
jgi:DNA polymerase-3 subunit epsilon